MNPHQSSLITPMLFARDWTKYDYVTETRLDVMKRKLSKAIDYLRNKIEYNTKIVRTLQDELCIQVEKFRKDYPIFQCPGKARDRRTVFVYNIGKDVDIVALKWHFELCGDVKDVVSLYDDKQANDVAYVEFEDEIYANIALCMSGSLFMGQRIQIVPKNMTVELNIMQALSTFWGEHLESQFELVGPIKSVLALMKRMSKHLNELMQIYIEVNSLEFSEKSGKIYELMQRSKIALSTIHLYRTGFANTY